MGPLEFRTEGILAEKVLRIFVSSPSDVAGERARVKLVADRLNGEFGTNTHACRRSTLVPGSRPFDLFDPDRKGCIKLYVKRVFITDEAETNDDLAFKQDAAHLLLDEARILDGNRPADARMFSDRMARVLRRSLGTNGV
jgi:hypothetical protein